MSTARPPFPTDVPASPPCKCCGQPAEFYATVDFHRSCEDHRQPALPPSGIAITYHRCLVCRFIFTVAFDGFTHADFLAFVYNDVYARVDPDFADVRPRANADFIARAFPPSSAALRVLDYGGGAGQLAGMLRERGFTTTASYDPFYGESPRPAGRFELVTCFEVLEHSTTPRETLRDIRAFIDDRGLLLFSTLLQPADIDLLGPAWWYIGPRNGHVSLYSREAMTTLMKQLGLKWSSFTDNLHIAYRGSVPRFARHLPVRAA